MLRQRTTALTLPRVLGLALLIAAVLTVGLGACAGNGAVLPPQDTPRSIVVESFPAEPAEESPPGPPVEGMTNAIVDATVRPARLTVTMWGTPGCMPYPVAVVWYDPWTVHVTTAPSDETRCTAEHLAVSQVVVLPVDHPADEVRTVRVDDASVAFAFRQ
ncbi:hypothetical protein [Promicromonospora sp. NPDC019610]|uniref:hypothetical protein n=1 Tax=Promicromonospora sp. NPDC019610 TaxID=3364405 RepID=UPI0037B2857C